jgi:hypothetical protein
MTERSLRTFTKAILAREVVKLALRPLVRWRPMVDPEAGFSIVLGVPWDLRHLLPVNLRFVSGTNLEGLRALHVVFDRRSREGMEEIARDARERFPGLPLVFQHYPRVAGWIVEASNVSTFYNSMNCATALARVKTRYAIMHDFDLFPLVPEYFQEVVGRMQRDGLRFCGLQRTHFDGLTDDDGILGTWCLGVDADWLRREHQALDIFHKVETIRGRWVTLDPFSALQRRTPERALVETLDDSAFCHVGNLCATYMRYKSGQRVRFAWKLHYLWYLEALIGADRLAEITAAMDAADDGVLRLADGFSESFRDVDPTCANVLRAELERMDRFLHGTCRSHVARYVDAFQAFLSRASSAAPVR